MIFSHLFHQVLFNSLLLSLIFFYQTTAFSEEVAWNVTPIEYSDIHLVNLNSDKLINDAKSKNKLNTLGLVGAITYTLMIEKSGWHQLLIEGSVTNLDVFVDKTGGADDLHRYEFHGVNNPEGSEQKVANIWLSEGKHELILSRYVWTGFPTINRIKLLRSSSSLSESAQIMSPHRRVSSINACQPYTLMAGKRSDARRLDWQIFNRKSRAFIGTGHIAVPASNQLSTLNLNFFCAKEGSYEVFFFESNNKLSKKEFSRIEYDVVDTNSKITLIPIDKPVKEIDATVFHPDYFSDPDFSVVKNSTSAWLESSDSGWVPFVRRDKSKQYLSRMPSWFAYRLDNLEIQKAYKVEIEFPDNADRSFIAAIQEGKQLPYPVSYGIDSGGPYALTHIKQKISFVFWPRTTDSRIVFLNANNGKRIAISSIRVYDVSEKKSVATTNNLNATNGRRSFANWYEEGFNFSGIYGALDTSIDEKKKSIERWFMLASASGVNLIVPTAAVYAFTLFPSQFDKAFSSASDYDWLKLMILIAQKYHINIIPEIHPRADPLLWPYIDLTKPYPNTLMSKDGLSFMLDGGKNEKNPRYFNPIFPENQEWYLNLIEEIVERYHSYDNFQGIHLRLMPWANPALNNFVSLDWGYDDYTFALFISENHLVVPTELNRSVAMDKNVARERYDWILKNWKEQWISWRCKKIANLYQRVVNRLRSFRPDLKVYSHVFWPVEDHGAIQILREAGIDPDLLSGIPGVELVNSQYAYGRREPSEKYNLKLHSQFFDQLGMTALSKHGAKPLFMTSAAYFEVTDEVVKPFQLGFSASVKNGWISSAASPAGRNSLERFAVVLAETDALMLGDGGNMYTFGQDEVVEFMKDFTALPNKAFFRISSLHSPVAIWDHISSEEHFFYVVNKTSGEIKNTIRFSSSAILNRLGSGEEVSLKNKELTLTIKPYELRAFKLPSSVKIVGFN